MNSVRALLRDILPFDPPTQVVLTTNLPEMVCVIVVRFAANRESLRLPPRLDRKLSGVRWHAVREPGEHVVALVLDEGPLQECVMNFSLKPAQSGAFTCWLQGGYLPRDRMLFGTLEDFTARSYAHKLRANVVEMVKYGLDAFGRSSGPELRQSERRPMQGTMRLRAGGRFWIAQLLNVSEGGLGVALSCTTAEAESLGLYLTSQKLLDVEMIEPRLAASFRVTVRHVQAVRGGLMVGLQVHDPKSIERLVQRAFGHG